MAKAGSEEGKASPQKASPQEAAAAPVRHMALARKYRPKTFSELIGQDAMVQTLRNAFAQGRIAQAYMLTGVRGVGKTTTARLVARGLNYVAPGIDAPTIDFTEEGEHCRAILEGRHLDVIEMDAASHTGIDDIRDLIDSAHYKPNTARYKVYIVDEVHMLSKQAFNGLLKTLEEPPEHVKFIFATTELRKVPVTVLSRCQRFDLRRIEIEPLTGHLAKIVKAEGADADQAALALIAKAAEGSVRDALSILDRAMAFSGGALRADEVRGLLGLADRSRIFDLLETLLKGDAGEALAQLSRLNSDGADPGQVMADLAEAVHAISREKALAGAKSANPPDAAIPEAEQVRIRDLAGRLSMPVLARTWQMLLKGHDEVRSAPRPLAAADMVLIRIAYAADLPSPADLIGRFGAPHGVRPGTAPAAGKPSHTDPAPVARHEAAPQAAESSIPPTDFQEAREQAADPKSFQDIVALAEAKRDLKLKHALMEQLRLVSFRPGTLEVHMLAAAPKELAQELSRALKRWTGRPWAVVVSTDESGAAEPLGETRRREKAEELERIRNHPAVKEVMAHFPDAEIHAVRPLRRAAAKTGDAADDGDFSDQRVTEDGTNR